MQFTLSRLLAAMALIAFGIAGVTLLDRDIDLGSYPRIVQAALLLHFWTSLIVIGAGIGLPFKRPFVGAAFGLLGTFGLALHVMVTGRFR